MYFTFTLGWTRALVVIGIFISVIGSLIANRGYAPSDVFVLTVGNLLGVFLYAAISAWLIAKIFLRREAHAFEKAFSVCVIAWATIMALSAFHNAGLI